MTLGEFVKELAALLHRDNIRMPFRNERPWHELFYELKSMPASPEKPAFFEELGFDWDGPYPKSRELSDFLQALHWNACVSASNPDYNTITLPPEVAHLWLTRLQQSDEETKSFLRHAVKLASQGFASTRDAIDT
jgi:hypothetical protein